MWITYLLFNHIKMKYKHNMAVCNVFKKLTKETGTFLTFSQYMEDLTIWQTQSKYHRIVPSKFIAIDCKNPQYTNITLPRYIQEYFENACTCFRNNEPSVVDGIDTMAIGWSPEYSKTLFWNMMFGNKELSGEVSSRGLITTDDIKYVGDINLQSYNEVDSMGYSEIYCHIPNEACSYKYSKSVTDYDVATKITRNKFDLLEGFSDGEMNGWEKLDTVFDGEQYEYLIDKNYTFSWEDNSIGTIKLSDKSFNINMIVVLYDIWNEDKVVVSGIPMGMYITGLINETNQVIQNSITKYVSNEDIYGAGTSYGLRICSRYVISPGEDKYIVKEVSLEDNNYGDLSRVLTQLSISQTKMDEVVNKTYNTDQNYKSLLAIFKNNRTNVPYIKIVNNESCWFVNGKLIGPSAVDGVYDAYSNDELDYLLDTKLNQAFQIIATCRDENDKYIFPNNGTPVDVVLKWDVYYEGKKIRPTSLMVSSKNEQVKDYTGANTAYFLGKTASDDFKLEAKYGILECSTTTSIYFVDPIYFGELDCAYHNLGVEPSDLSWVNQDTIKKLTQYISNTQEHTYAITTDYEKPGHICYAFPASLGELKYIKDSDGYIYFDYEKYVVDPNDESNSFMFKKIEKFQPWSERIDYSVDYNVYVSKVPAYVNNLNLIFKKNYEL